MCVIEWHHCCKLHSTQYPCKEYSRVTKQCHDRDIVPRIRAVETLHPYCQQRFDELTENIARRREQVEEWTGKFNAAETLVEAQIEAQFDATRDSYDLDTAADGEGVEAEALTSGTDDLLVEDMDGLDAAIERMREAEEKLHDAQEQLQEYKAMMEERFGHAILHLNHEANKVWCAQHTKQLQESRKR